MASENEDTTNTTITPEGTDTGDQVPVTPEEETESSIELIVEDGSCVSGANCCISLEDADKYMFDRNREAWTELTDIQKASALIRANQYVDNLFPWKGRRKYESQTLAFPRVPKFPDRNLRDLDGFDFTGKMHKRYISAVCEAAWYGYESDLFTTYAVDAGGLGAIKREKINKRVEGAVQKETEYEYFSNKESTSEYISKYAALDSILKGLYINKNSKTVNSRADWGW